MSDDDDDDGSSVDSFVERPQEVLSPAAQHYLEKCYSIKILFAMSIGQTNEAGDALVDATKEPWSTLKKNVKPSLTTLIGEIKRRQPGDTAPRYRKWNAEQCMEWLISNPITDEKDVAFLKKKCMDFYASFQAAALEEQEMAAIIAKRRRLNAK
jgi:hypothetical protein